MLLRAVFPLPKEANYQVAEVLTGSLTNNTTACSWYNFMNYSTASQLLTYNKCWRCNSEMSHTAWYRRYQKLWASSTGTRLVWVKSDYAATISLVPLHDVTPSTLAGSAIFILWLLVVYLKNTKKKKTDNSQEGTRWKENLHQVNQIELYILTSAEIPACSLLFHPVWRGPFLLAGYIFFTTAQPSFINAALKSPIFSLGKKEQNKKHNE